MEEYPSASESHLSGLINQDNKKGDRLPCCCSSKTNISEVKPEPLDDDTDEILPP